jgi:RNA polymerase sigma-70 factor (ECF subfamily)
MRIVSGNRGRRDEPEDLAQEVFLRVFSRLEQYRGEVPVEHWVRRIALNTCLDHLRRQKARPELRWSDLGEAEQALLTATPPEATASETERIAARELAGRLLAALPPADAWLLGELEMEGRTIAEVCAATGWNAGVARIRAFRARQRLKALWRKLEKEQR